ncbi:MAG: RsmB/NOP family class I SAM-dependent RNA methyltransferase [Waddliaceae bacterium]
MLKRPFREHHILKLLKGYEAQHLPLDLFLSHYFRANKALGSKDRAVITETIYAMVRWKGLLDHLCQKPPAWEKRLDKFHHFQPEEYLNRPNIPEHVRLSFPKTLYHLILDSFGEEKARELCLVSNQPAPTTVRINPLKTTRKEMLNLWTPDYTISPCKVAKHGILFHKKINFFGLPEFKAGLFEVQDEGSQLLADLMHVEPGQHVLDYCAGSGGKTLAFAHRMKGSGQIYLHDLRSAILLECRKRMRRAGIQNSQIVKFDDPKLEKLKKRMDWVLVDAPCTGTGTMRRNPEMKWRFTEETLPRLIGQQRMIFEKALRYVRPGGRIVYGTCSLLQPENQDQVEHFLRTYPLEIEGPFLQSLPKKGSMDGFFGAVLRTKTYEKTPLL